METFTSIIEAAKKTGKQIEVFTNIADRFGDRVRETTVLRVEIKPSIWFTWECTPKYDANTRSLKFDENAYLFFMGRYNQNNGVTQKTYKKEQSAFRALGLV